MQTVEWTDGKLEERLERIDERFDGVNRRITETAEATDHRLKEVERRITETAEGTDRRLTETAKETDRRLSWVEEEVRGLKKGMQTLHGDIHRATIALWVGSAGVAAAILVKGG
jgi:DNA anti-recombination protein RmuC